MGTSVKKSAKPRKAKLFATCFEVRCPHCDAEQAEPSSGSLTLWNVAQVYDETYTCPDCGGRYIIRVGKRISV